MVGEPGRIHTHTTRVEGGAYRVSVAGELDLGTSPSLEREIRDLPQADVELDLAEVDFIDAVGLHCLMQVHATAARRGRRVRCVACSSAVTSLLDMTGTRTHVGC